MVLGYEWHSFQGTGTKDNRDYCGIARRPDSTMSVVLDGATRGPSGGELVRELAYRLVDQFLGHDMPVDAAQIYNQLQQAHKDLRHRYPADSASYLIMIDTHDGQLMTAHAGDCRLGKLRKDKSVEWLTKPHCLANATADLAETELAAHANRHQLSRSFRPRRFQEPEYGQFTSLPDDVLLIATDGFWAEMNSLEQSELLEGRYKPSGSVRDDRSCLLLRSTSQTRKAEQVESSENIYIQPK